MQALGFKVLLSIKPHFSKPSQCSELTNDAELNVYFAFLLIH